MTARTTSQARHALKLTARGDREIEITRKFDAPREFVFQALTRPEHLRRWMLGPAGGGWTMPVCDVDLRPGGAYRFVWRNAEGAEMGMGGVFEEISPPERFTAKERFDEPWYPGEMFVTQALDEKDGVTTLTVTLRYDSREARDIVLGSPMEQGMAAGYDRLDGVLAASAA